MTNTATAVISASSAKTANGNTAAIAVPSGANNLAVLANVTTVSGTTPSMTLSVEWSNDGTTFAQVDGTADTFAAMTASGAKVKAFAVKGAWFRLVWTITGTTPSFTFDASASGI